MDWKEQIIVAWHWLLEKPDVVWSGIGTTLLVAVCSWLYTRLHKSNNDSVQNPATTWLANNRQKLLDRLQWELDTRLQSFLLGRKSLDLEKTLSPEQVHHSQSIWDSLACTLERDNAAAESTDETVAALFHRPDVGKRLAILGKPGSGKTVSLLKLVEHLLQEAAKKPSAPLPVVFECSEWDGRELSLWMAAQLRRKYEIREDTARQLVQERDILPLFDGLDELAAEKQGDFVRCFNAFADERPLAVCCREQEYRHLQEKTGQKLALNTAVILQDIAEEKLAAYLHREGLDDLRRLLRQSEIEAGQSSPAPAAEQHRPEPPQSLLHLARRPMFLGLMIAVADKLGCDFRPPQGETWEDCIWRLYLDYCLQENRPDRNRSPDYYAGKYSKEQSLHWLQCLARWMQTENKVALQIDELQPSMIQNYWPVGLLYIIVYILFFGMIGLFFKGPIRDVKIGTLLGVEVGLFFWLFFMKKNFNAKMAHYLLIAMPLTYLVGMIFILVHQQKHEARQLLAVMIIVGFFAALFDRLRKGLKLVRNQLGENIYRKELLYDVLHSSLMLFPVLTFTSMIIFFLLMSLVKWIYFAINFSFNWSIFYLVLFGIVASNFLVLRIEDVLQHYLLRICLRLEGQLPLRLVPWLAAVHQRKVLQQVGGSYHFLHKQLQEYLAKQRAMKKQAA